MGAGWLAVMALLCGRPALSQESGLSPQAEAVELAMQAFEPATLGDWQLACDNHARCTLLGHAGMADPNQVVGNDTRSMAVRIEVAAGGEVERLAFIPDEQVTAQAVVGVSWTAHFVLAVDPLGGEALHIPFGRSELAGGELALVLRHLGGGTPLFAADRLTGELRIRLPHAGFADALAEVRRRQAHVLHWRALLDPDDGPVRLVRAAPAIVSGVPEVTAAQMDWCPAGIDAANLVAYDLGPAGRLWRHDCPFDGRNRWSRWFLAAPGASTADVMMLPRTSGFTTAESGASLPNAMFDFDFGVLRSVNRAIAGREDCGRMVVWGWTGQAFVVLERRIAVVCGGLDLPDWLVTWSRESVVEEQP